MCSSSSSEHWATRACSHGDGRGSREQAEVTGFLRLRLRFRHAVPSALTLPHVGRTAKSHNKGHDGEVTNSNIINHTKH